MAQHPNMPFELVTSTNALRKIPNMYGRAVQSGLFSTRTSPTKIIRIQEVTDGVLSVIPSKPRGAEPSTLAAATRKFRYLEIPHFPLIDHIVAEAIQDSVDWNTGETLDGMTEAVARAMLVQANAHAITQEYWYMGALKGILKDADGSTVYNLYTEFGITQEVHDFKFTVSTTKIQELCLDVSRHIEDNLLGDTMTGVEVWCSPGFFDELISHATVKAAFSGYSEAANRMGGDPRMNFTYGGLRFSEYRGSVSGTPFIPTDTAIAVPTGTRDTFETYWGPPVLNGISGVNMMGSPGPYALQTRDPKGRWIDLDSEMNCLPICKRPGVLVKLTMS